MRLFRSHVLASSPVAIALVLALALAISVAPVSAQSRGSVASIHGHVQDPLQMPVTDGVIKLTQDTGVIDKGSRFLYTFNTDSNGDYKGTNITAGTYSVIVFRGDKSLDFADKITFEAGVDTKLDFDMSRAEYLSKMSAEDKKTLEEYRKKNAAIAAQNGVVKNLNALLQQARDVMNPAKTNPPDYEKAITLMTQATQAKPDEPVLWFTLGSAYVGAKKYDQAVPALQKSIDLNNSSKKASAATAGAAYNSLGEALASLGKVPDAATAYESAAKANPSSAAAYYSNEAISLYKAGQTDYKNQKADYAGAVVAADKTVAADPTFAIAYYVKGSALVVDSTVDPNTQKMTAPPGCIEAYQNYLKYAPNGPFAAEVKGVLAGFGETITTSFGKTGKH